MTQNTSVGYIPASKTASDLTLYVYEDATGTGDGSSKANGFTSLQAAIDAIPDVAQNVTVIVCKGSTNYLGQTTTIQKASVKSLTIQGEYYWYANCDANASTAGRIVDADIDTTGMAVGDRVVCTHYSGTVGSSSIDDYFYATITEVGEGYIQTSEETKVPTAGWRYLINQTVFDGDGSRITTTQDTYCTIVGITFVNTNTAIIKAGINSNQIIDKCIIADARGIFVSAAAGVYISNSAFVSMHINIPVIDVYGGYSVVGIDNTVFNLESVSSKAIYLNGSSGVIISYCGVFVAGYALVNAHTCSNVFIKSCYIDSSCTYGAYGYNITLTNCTNNAATPVYNLTSGGSIEEWDGQALPSIADATGGQVLALKSDKSGIEFATVDLDTLGAASSTTATQSIYVDAAATGAGDGSSWTNAFTTIKAAVNSLPAVINHAVTIIIRKGSTPYDENITIQRVIAAGSITLIGEYFWYGTVAASETGKITVGVSDYGYADRAQIEAGDVIWATKWSGAVGASAPTESIIDTVSSVSGAEVSLTTNAGKTIDTSWTYYITHTKFAFTGSNCITLLLSSVFIKGIHLHSIDAAQIATAYNGMMSLNLCAITSDVSVSCIRGEQRAHISVNNTLIKSNGSGIGIYLLGRTLLDMNKCVLSGLNDGLKMGSSDSNNWFANNHIMNTVNIGITAGGNSYIRVATGSSATLIEAVTPKSPATSSEGSYIW